MRSPFGTLVIQTGVVKNDDPGWAMVYVGPAFQRGSKKGSIFLDPPNTFQMLWMDPKENARHELRQMKPDLNIGMNSLRLQGFVHSTPGLLRTRLRTTATSSRLAAQKGKVKETQRPLGAKRSLKSGNRNKPADDTYFRFSAIPQIRL